MQYFFVILLGILPGMDQAFTVTRASADVRTEVVRICTRESHCQPVSTHELDGRYGRSMYENAMRVGWLNADCREEYDQIPGPEWAPRGLYGMSPSYHFRRVKDLFDENCPHPSRFDDPFIATMAAIRYIQAYQKQGCAARLRSWAGPGIWRKRSAWHKLTRLWQTCGPWVTFYEIIS